MILNRSLSIILHAVTLDLDLVLILHSTSHTIYQNTCGDMFLTNTHETYQQSEKRQSVQVKLSKKVNHFSRYSPIRKFQIDLRSSGFT